MIEEKRIEEELNTIGSTDDIVLAPSSKRTIEECEHEILPFRQVHLLVIHHHPYL